MGHGGGPVVNPILVPLQDYQLHMLTRELAALVDMGIASPPFVDAARTRWGATRAEAETILQGVRRAAA